ncbi:MAG: flagellar biosynthesis protein FlgA [Hyphomicrobiaceae bacterium]
MNFMQLFKPAHDKPVSAALAGAGEFGLSLIAQSRRMRGLMVVAAMDREPARVGSRLSALGVDYAVCESPAAAKVAGAAGKLVLTGLIEVALAVAPDMLVEATGHQEGAVVHALAAIEAGIGVVMVSKEAECVVGPALAARAAQAGVPYTLVEGDQPALLISLLTWCEALGLPVVAAGKSSEYDYVFDPATGDVSWTTERVAAPSIARHWTLASDRRATIAARAEALVALPQRTVPDFCEMSLVANALGLVPDRPDFHAPMTRAAELPEIYIPESDGGLLRSRGILDVFNCLRRPDEASFAGGVFAVVEWADAASGALFRGKGIPTTADGKFGLVYNPSHLLGVEAPVSIISAARLANTSVDTRYRQVVDLTAVATRDLPAGHLLDIVGSRHAVPGLEPRLTPAARIAAGSPLPYYMAVGQRLARAVKAGAMLMSADVVAPSGSALWTLRMAQDGAG